MRYFYVEFHQLRCVGCPTFPCSLNPKPRGKGESSPPSPRNLTHSVSPSHTGIPTTPELIELRPTGLAWSLPSHAFGSFHVISLPWPHPLSGPESSKRCHKTVFFWSSQSNSACFLSLRAPLHGGSSSLFPNPRPPSFPTTRCIYLAAA